MKQIFLLVFLTACVSGSTSYDPSDHLTIDEQTRAMGKIARFLAKPPDNASFEERFSPSFDRYYQKQAAMHRLDAYCVKGETQYFLVSRRAPSLANKRVSTGGHFKWNDKGEIVEYVEEFRTWKMPDSVLVRKSIQLFDIMVKGKSLEPYLTKNSFPEEYIEFPDEHVVFDKEKQQWVTIP